MEFNNIESNMQKENRKGTQSVQNFLKYFLVYKIKNKNVKP